VASTLIYGLTGYWSLSDELGCHFADPALRIDWPDCEPVLSARDRDAGSLAALREAFCNASAPSDT